MKNFVEVYRQRLQETDHKSQIYHWDQWIISIVGVGGGGGVGIY